MWVWEDGREEIKIFSFIIALIRVNECNHIYNYTHENNPSKKSYKIQKAKTDQNVKDVFKRLCRSSQIEFKEIPFTIA